MATPAAFSAFGGTTAEGRLNPLLWLWRAPRRTVRSLVANDPKRFVLLIGALEGFTLFAMPSDEYDLKLSTVLAIAAVMGPWLGMGLILLRGRCDAVAGQWLGGSAATGPVRCALAWSRLPMLFATTIALAIHAITGSNSFAGAMVLLVGVIASAALYVVMLAELQAFTIFRAFAQSLLGSALSVVMLFGPIIAALLIHSAVSG